MEILATASQLREQAGEVDTYRGQIDRCIDDLASQLNTQLFAGFLGQASEKFKKEFDKYHNTQWPDMAKTLQNVADFLRKSADDLERADRDSANW